MEPDKPLDKNPLSRQQPAIEPPRASFILKNAATEGTILNAETQRNAEKRREEEPSANLCALCALCVKSSHPAIKLGHSSAKSAEKRREEEPSANLWSLDILRTGKQPIPKGLHHSARGCAPRATPGDAPHKLFPNPEPVVSVPCANDARGGGKRCNPYRVAGVSGANPG